jgi:hypothetical protein
MKITKSQLKQIIKEEITKVLSADDLYLAEMFDTTSAGTAHTPTGTTQLSPAQEACRKATKGKGVLRPDGCFDERGNPIQLQEEDRTAKGNVTQDARDDHATLSDGRFPIFDKKSALAALKLRGHGTTAAEREKIINKAAEYAPDAAKKAREADREAS